MQTVNAIVLKEEMDRKKTAKTSMSRQEKGNYVIIGRRIMTPSYVTPLDLKMVLNSSCCWVFHVTINIKGTISFSAGSVTGGRCPHELWEIHSIFSVWDQCKWNYVSIRICLVVW
jgi:hypothetical protein